MAKYNITPPDLNECKSYEAYKRELTAWSAVTDLAKNKQGNFVVLSLPNKSKFGNDIRERAFESLPEDELNSDDGLKNLLKFLDAELGKNEVDDIIEKWDQFDSCKKSEDQALDDFIADFEAKYNRIKGSGTTLPQEILAYMLMKRAGLSHIEKMLILSRINIEKKETLFKDVKTNMKNILGKRLQEKKSTEDQLKLEPVFLAQNEEVLAAAGYYRKRSNTMPTKGNYKQHNQKWQKKYEKTDGKHARNVNPAGKDGKPLLCKACGSFRHFIKDCPDSHENKGKGLFLTEEVMSDEDGENSEVNRFVLFTSDNDELSRFTSESLNAAALDTCCTTSVAGENWIKIYLNSLPEELREKVKGPFEGEKWFQFGNEGILKSKASYVLPAKLGDVSVMIEVEVIESDIPLLLSKSAMKKAGMIIFLSEDKAEVFGKKICLNTTSAGHYVIPLLDKSDSCTPEVEEIHLNTVFATNLITATDEEKAKALDKLHKQFGHRPKESFVNLLKAAGCWSPDMSTKLDKIIEGCEGCIKRKRNPDRPAVAMPMASEFNEKVAIDLSFYKGKVILHIIDMWSRLTVSTCIQRKKPSEVIDKIMQKWVANYGVMSAILNDNGGEFTAEEMREVKSVLNVIDLTTGAESPWQNGICEKNHALVDNILARIDEDLPDTDLETKLAWAGMAKNSLQMTYGYSPNQLVFGQNPKLPNIITDGPPAWEETTTSEMIAKHLNTLHAARKAFIKSESCNRLKAALKAKIRTNNTVYESGDIVYYKRKDDHWMGPAKVAFQDGKVVFIRHGSAFVRVSTNRICKAGAELAKKYINDELAPGATETSGTEDSGFRTAITPATAVVREEDDGLLESAQGSDSQEQETVNDPQARSLKINLKKNEVIKFKENGQWVQATILGRGKVTGKYKNWFNVSRQDGTENHSVDLENVDYEVIPVTIEVPVDAEEAPVNTEEAFMVLVPKEDHGSESCLLAKKEELNKLAEFNTYKEVENTGQDFITTTWVMSKKGDAIKARLVARGFEETVNIQSDSPTLSKVGLRILATIAAARNWIIETTDIKSAFLQGSTLERTVYVKPPKEADAKGKLWMLYKALYGLKDASRQWFFRVKDQLTALGCQQSALDPGIFLKRDRQSNLCGVIGLHVDDFLHAGNEEFNRNVMEEINVEFKVGKNEKGNFVYTGFSMCQEPSAIRIDMSQYTESIDIPNIDSNRALQKHSELTAAEKTDLRKMAGALNWVVRGCRPDLSFELIEASTKFQNGSVADLVRIRKVLTNLKEQASSLVIPNLGKREDWALLCYTDASLGNLNDGISSTGGYILFLANLRTGKTSPLDWQSHKIKRVVRSTLAAETLSLCEGLEAAIHVNYILQEVTGHSDLVPVHAIIDNHSTVEAVRSTTSVDDRRLRRDIAAIKQLLESGDITSLSWVSGSKQLADVLTKRGVNGGKLLQILQSGELAEEDLMLFIKK